MRPLRHLFCAVALGASFSLPAGQSPAQQSPAQTWPQRTVKIIVPNPPGVLMDVIARLFAERLSSRWKQAVIVENLPGPDGIVAAREFASRHDDHTLLYSFPGLITINPLVHEKLPYDPSTDLTPIASTSDNFLAIAASVNLNASSLNDLATVARARNNKISWAATPGLPYYAFTAFRKSVGADMVHVPYRDFNQAVVDLSQGRIDALASGVAPLLAPMRAGKIRLLAFLNGTRAPVAPDIPTAREAGYPDLTFSAVTGFFGWRGMPMDLRERIASDVRTILADPTIRERLAATGAAAMGSTPAGYAASIEEQRAQVLAIARDGQTK